MRGYNPQKERPQLRYRRRWQTKRDNIAYNILFGYVVEFRPGGALLYEQGHTPLMAQTDQFSWQQRTGNSSNVSEIQTLRQELADTQKKLQGYADAGLSFNAPNLHLE